MSDVIDPRADAETLFRTELAKEPTRENLFGLVEAACAELSELFHRNAAVGVFTTQEIATYSFCSCVIAALLKASAHGDLAFGDSEKLVSQLVGAVKSSRGRTVRDAITPRLS